MIFDKWCESCLTLENICSILLQFQNILPAFKQMKLAYNH